MKNTPNMKTVRINAEEVEKFLNDYPAIWRFGYKTNGALIDELCEKTKNKFDPFSLTVAAFIIYETQPIQTLIGFYDDVNDSYDEETELYFNVETYTPNVAPGYSFDLTAFIDFEKFTEYLTNPKKYPNAHFSNCFYLCFDSFSDEVDEIMSQALIDDFNRPTYFYSLASISDKAKEFENEAAEIIEIAAQFEADYYKAFNLCYFDFCPDYSEELATNIELWKIAKD